MALLKHCKTTFLTSKLEPAEFFSEYTLSICAKETLGTITMVPMALWQNEKCKISDIINCVIPAGSCCIGAIYFNPLQLTTAHTDKLILRCQLERIRTYHYNTSSKTSCTTASSIKHVQIGLTEHERVITCT